MAFSGELRAWTPLRVALAVALAGLVARAVVSFLVVPAWEARAGVGAFPDAYDQLARTLIERGTLGFGEAGATPTTLRGPGYPAWLALGMLVAGRSSGWLGFWSGLPGIAVAGWMAAGLAGRYGVLAGLAGGLATALHPLGVMTSARTMGDEFHAALGWAALAAAAVALWSGDTQRPSRWALAGGALMAWHLLSRSSGLLTLFALVALLPFRRPLRPRLVAVVLAVALVPALAWSVRSSLLESRPVFVQSLAGYNFWLGEGFHRFGPDRFTGEHHVERMELILERAGLDPARAQSFIWRDLTPEESARTERRLQRAALELVRAHPLGYLRRCVVGIYGFWTAGETVERTRQYRLVMLPALLLAAWGAVRVWRGDGRTDELGRVLVLDVAVHNAAYAAIKGMARNSAQLTPAVGYLMGVAIADLARRARARSLDA